MANTASVSTAKTIIRPLAGQIAIVTGSARGVGRGIALQLGDAGATVYMTGRAPDKSHSAVEKSIPTLEKTARELADRGGKPVPVYCDHSNDGDVKKLFERVEKDTGGVLDIHINAAYSGVPAIVANAGKKFYECDPTLWDEMNNVGLRNVYVCCVYAARMMAKRGSGLIVNISSGGGLQYVFDVPYGVGKAAVDRMGIDMAHELKNTGITIVTLWPGPNKTELGAIGVHNGTLSKAMGIPQNVFDVAMKSAETPEFVGKAVVALANDKKRYKKSGSIQITGDLAKEYGFTDVGGVMPGNMRSVRSALEFFSWVRLARLVPGFIKVPKPFLHFASYKF